MPARIYKIIEVAGSSTVGTDDAIRCAIAKAVEIEWELHVTRLPFNW